MTGFFEATQQAVRTGLCGYLDFAGKGVSWVNELSPVDLPDFGNFWNRALCDRNESLPQSPPPFTGGQCPGVIYDVTYTRQIRDSACDGYFPPAPPTTTGPFTGPISGITSTTEETPTGFRDFLLVSDATGSTELGSSTRASDCGLTAQFTNISVTRRDGNPDDCGDPAPVVPPFPPSGDTINITVNYTNNEGDNVTELGDFNLFAPVVIAPVTVVAPIRVNLPDVSFNGQIVLSPDFRIELTPPDFDRSPGDTDGPPPPPDPTTSPGTPDDDSNRRVIGAIVTVSQAIQSKATSVDGGDGPDLFVPRLGTLAFRVRVSGALAWGGNYDVKATTQFFPAPSEGLTVDAVFTPIPSVTGAVTLVYSEPQTLP
jgi:hypothetical protein